MIPSFLDKLSGLLDRRFIEAYWSPVFLFFGLLLLTAVTIYSPAEVLGWWAGRDTTSKALAAFGALFLITVLAYLLSACSGVLTQIYTGFWLGDAELAPLRFFRKWGVERQTLRRRATADYERFSRYRVAATRLGNVLASAYDYALHTYGVEGVVWWPRLTAVLPEGFRARVDATLTPLTALLNVCTLLAGWTLVSSVALLALDDRPWAFALCLPGGALLSYAFYRAAVWQAAEFGNLVRAAYDLYRHEILKQMRAPLPHGASAERALWQWLEAWVRAGMPGERFQADVEEEMFPYDTRPPGRERLEVSWGRLPPLTISRRGEAEEG